jgi:anti-sigma regulatory factor (Ser/Thr protein kinase)
MESSDADIVVDSIEYPASMDHWDSFTDFTKSSITKFISDSSLAYKFFLAFEELISNIIRSSEKHSARQATLTIRILKRNLDDKDWLVVQTVDTGIQFDPHYHQRNPVDTKQPVHERAIGGLGIFLIEQSVDCAHYQWLNGSNVNEISICIQPVSS